MMLLPAIEVCLGNSALVGAGQFLLICYDQSLCWEIFTHKIILPCHSIILIGIVNMFVCTALKLFFNEVSLWQCNFLQLR